MTVKLLTELHLEFLSFKGGCTGSSESTLVKMLHCWKSHALAQLPVHSKWYTRSVLVGGLKGIIHCDLRKIHTVCQC